MSEQQTPVKHKIELCLINVSLTDPSKRLLRQTMTRCNIQIKVAISFGTRLGTIDWLDTGVVRISIISNVPYIVPVSLVVYKFTSSTVTLYVLIGHFAV